MDICALCTPYLYMLTQGVLNENLLVTSSVYKLWICFFFMLYESINIFTIYRLRQKESISVVLFCVVILNTFIVFLLFGLFV